MMLSGARSRLVGAAFMLVGCAVAGLMWAIYRSEGFYSLFGAWLGPFVATMGVWMLIEGPELPAHRLSLLGKLFACTGTILGLAFALALDEGWLR
jgi:hypothetical protein